MYRLKLTRFPLQVVHYDIDTVFKDTPLYGWGLDVQSGRVKSDFMAAHLSDALRLALIHKYRALYMDLDFIVSSVWWLDYSRP